MGNRLSLQIDEETLRRDFEECGEITNLKILLNKDTGESRGLAFITFKDEAGFNAALRYNGDNYGGRPLDIRKAESKGAGQAIDKSKPLGPKPAGCNSVVLKGLLPELTEASLRKIFKKCGNGPRHVGLLKDKAGKSRGTARVDFNDEEAVDAAIELFGTAMHGKASSIDYCKPS